MNLIIYSSFTGKLLKLEGNFMAQMYVVKVKVHCENEDVAIIDG